MRQRLKKVVIHALILIGIGALYAVFVTLTGIGIPCVFHLVTGLNCPGCGVSRMCLRLFRLDFAGAFRANAVLLCMSPLLLATGARLAYLYVRRGETRDTACRISELVMIVILLSWGIVRNIIKW